MGSCFGPGIDYDDGWGGRYIVQKSELRTLAVNPGISYRVNDMLSVGGWCIHSHSKADATGRSAQPIAWSGGWAI